MSNVTVFNPSANLPSFVKKGALSAVAQALAGGADSGKRVSIKGGVFRLMANGKEVTSIDERYLDVVIINAAPKVHRTFFAKVYDESEAAQSPDCWSVDGDKPDPTSKAPQHTNCAQCPKNVKGSGQGDTRACRFGQRLALRLANDIEGDTMGLSLPATSIFGKAEGDNRPLQEYARYLVAQGVDPSHLVTRMKFDTTAATPKLFFKAMRYLTEEEFAVTSVAAEQDDAIKAITMSVNANAAGGAKALPAPAPAEDEEPPAPAPKVKKAAAPAPAAEPDGDDEPPAPAPKPKAKAKPAAAPAPAADPDDEPPAPEPKVKAKPATAAAPAASGLAAVLGDWDDE
jgi:hypothetical protein